MTDTEVLEEIKARWRYLDNAAATAIDGTILKIMRHEAWRIHDILEEKMTGKPVRERWSPVPISEAPQQAEP